MTSVQKQTFKLCVHQRNFSVSDILINSKEFPDIKENDILEIYDTEDDDGRLLLQVKSITEDFQQKDAVSIEQSIATAFQLRAYRDVYVSKMNPKNVTLDLAEFLFKEQYYSRSDMWRMRKSQVNTCAYLNKKVEFAEMRAQVNELWSKGERVTCGVISDDTRIVFRSSTSVVNIFLQMSSEMWDFDLHGDLYFEKAVNGFLTDLFAKWKDQNCCHDVTIVLFSRTFYEAQSKDDFPMYMQDCLQVDHQGRIYEDFYRIVIQNERYDDWTATLMKLKSLFNEYLPKILHYHEHSKHRIPKAWNSTSSQGNFLETLNMSLNLFEKYYLDRNFDRTGKLAVVITPGAGVFEVNRELANITKQRTIDCGVGSDLVCMGEQPLHAVPLFKFQSKQATRSLVVDNDYNIPHWMNHSFYASKSQMQFHCTSAFIPRIKLPPEVIKDENTRPKLKIKELYDRSSTQNDDNFPFIDYDEYDSKVFKLPSRGVSKAGAGRNSTPFHTYKPRTLAEAKQHRLKRTRFNTDDFVGLYEDKSESQFSSSSAIRIPPRSRSGDSISSSFGCMPVPPLTGRMASHESLDSSEGEEIAPTRPVVGSAGSPIGHSRHLHTARPQRALINPFAPSRMQFKMTSNRRRWVHAFPRDPKGAAVQTHHIHSTSSLSGESPGDVTSGSPTREVFHAAQNAVEVRKQAFIRQESQESSDLIRSTSPSIYGLDGIDVHQRTISSMDSILDHGHFGLTTVSSTASISSLGHQEQGKHFATNGMSRNQSILKDNNKYCLWGVTGEQEWTSDMTTGWDWRPLDCSQTYGAESRLIKPILNADIHSQNFCAGISVDWKSLTIPASLPITTDYFPDKRSLQMDYVVSDYNLLPEDINMDYWSRPTAGADEAVYRRKPLTTRQVFTEMISQRLSQGFQLIVFSKHLSEFSPSSITASPQCKPSMKAIRGRFGVEHNEEYYLSIGRIFHKLSLNGYNITVTRYRPRHPHVQMFHEYRYRFQAPDSYNYDVSWTEFNNEKLENYNWNYLDQYILTNGLGDFGLIESLKFWRCRFFLLPSSNAATKKIIDGHKQCDIYEEKNVTDYKSLISGFLRFIEILNKIRRSAQTRRTMIQVPSDSSSTGPTGESRNTASASGQDKQHEEDVLNVHWPSKKIIVAMLDSVNGVPYLTEQPGLPYHCFVAAEAVSWCQQNVQGVASIPSGVQLMQRLIDDKLVCHAAGYLQHKFLYGFYLYYIIAEKNKGISLPYGMPINNKFQNEWCEVMVLPVSEKDDHLDGFYQDASPPDADITLSTSSDDWRSHSGQSGQTWVQQNATIMHKFVHVDIDATQKSDRVEWGTARYHANYSPKCAFELQFHWMVATGCIFGDLVYSWARKASSCGFHLLPVPIDPFALPYTSNSDPLRGPIYIPLNTAMLLPDGGTQLFSESDEECRTEKTKHFQDAIIKRYGFMPDSVRIPKAEQFSYDSDQRHQIYVHCTGGMFVMIPNSTIQSLQNKGPVVMSSSFGKPNAKEMHTEFIARQTSSVPQQSKAMDAGFLWSWNFMSSKRWSSCNTGDEQFQDKMLADLRKFCDGKDGRLAEFWLEYRVS